MSLLEAQHHQHIRGMGKAEPSATFIRLLSQLRQEHVRALQKLHSTRLSGDGYGIDKRISDEYNGRISDEFHNGLYSPMPMSPAGPSPRNHHSPVKRHGDDGIFVHGSCASDDVARILSPEFAGIAHMVKLPRARSRCSTGSERGSTSSKGRTSESPPLSSIERVVESVARSSRELATMNKIVESAPQNSKDRGTETLEPVVKSAMHKSRSRSKELESPSRSDVCYRTSFHPEVTSFDQDNQRDDQRKSGTSSTPVMVRKTRSDKSILDRQFSTGILESEQATVLNKVRGYSNEKKETKDPIFTSELSSASFRQTGLCFRILKSKYFDTACGAVILINCIILGLLAQTAADNHKYTTDPPLYLDIPDKTCSIWFLIELIVRSSVGWRHFFLGRTWMWNVFDLIVVLLDVIDNVARLIVGGEKSVLKNFLALRVLRIFRVIRILRLLKFCHDLQLILHSIRQCGRSLVWALVLVLLVIYLFAMYFMQNVTDYQYYYPDNKYTDKLHDQWGSIYVSTYTLFMVMADGVSWIEVSEPLIHMGWFHCLVLCFFVFFTLFVLTNVITTIFVDTAIQNTNQDREEVIAKKLRERDAQLSQMASIFADADTEGTGLITLEQLQMHMCDARVRAYLRSVDLDVSQASSLFALLDDDGSGTISITEFVFGCMRLKGAARSVDVAVLMHDIKFVHETLADIREVIDIQRYESDAMRDLLVRLAPPVDMVV